MLLFQTLPLSKDKQEEDRVEVKVSLKRGDKLVGIRAHAKALAWDENDPHKVTQWAANLWQLQFIVASETNDLTQAQEQEDESIQASTKKDRATSHNVERATEVEKQVINVRQQAHSSQKLLTGSDLRYTKPIGIKDE